MRFDKVTVVVALSLIMFFMYLFVLDACFSVSPANGMELKAISAYSVTPVTINIVKHDNSYSDIIVNHVAYAVKTAKFRDAMIVVSKASNTNIDSNDVFRTEILKVRQYYHKYEILNGKDYINLFLCQLILGQA